MSILDVPIILGMLFFTVLGYRDGFFKKVYATVAFWTGLLIAVHGMHLVAIGILDILPVSSASAHIAGFFLLFVIFILAENLFYRKFGVNEHDSLRPWSRIAGALIGFFEGAIAVSLLLIMLNVLNDPGDELREQSMFYARVINVTPRFFDITMAWAPDNKPFIESLKYHFTDMNIPQE